MTKLEQIRKKCIEANPEIVELKMGCEFYFCNPDTPRTKIPCVMVSDTHYKIIAKNQYIWSMTKYHIEGLNGEIIGRPIRLADVLMMIELKKDSRYVAPKAGQLLGFDADGGEMYWEPNLGGRNGWNLADNNLENQAKECIDFIYSLVADK